jgi:hypothetical protein
LFSWNELRGQTERSAVAQQRMNAGTMHHANEHDPPSILPAPANTTDDSVPPSHPAALESGDVLRWVKEDLLSIERVGAMCNKDDNHWILLIATGIANLIKDPPEKCVISTLDSFNGDNSYEACIFREFLKMYIRHHIGRDIYDDLFTIYKVVVPGNCMQRDVVNCGIYLGVYMTNMFDPTFSIEETVKDSTRDKIINTRRKFYEFLRGKHQKNIDKGKYHSEFYNVHSIDNGRIFVPHHQIPAGETCVILSASDLNGKDIVDLGLEELARVNPLYEDWLNDTIVQYFYYNKLNLRHNKTNRVFRCLSTFFITRMMREYRLDPSNCGYTTATSSLSVMKSTRDRRSSGSSASRNVSDGSFPRPKRDLNGGDEEDDEAKRFCMNIVEQNGFGHLL